MAVARPAALRPNGWAPPLLVSPSNTSITTADSCVARVIATLRAAGIEPWIEGGWAVDLLCGTSRPHADLDVGVVADDLSLPPDGRVCKELKRRWKDGTTHVVMTPEVLI